MMATDLFKVLDAITESNKRADREARERYRGATAEVEDGVVVIRHRYGHPLAMMPIDDWFVLRKQPAPPKDLEWEMTEEERSV
jgi:hypothetical protein